MSTCHIERVCEHVLLLRVTEGERENGSFIFGCIARLRGDEATLQMAMGTLTKEHRQAIREALYSVGVKKATWIRWKSDRAYRMEKTR